MKYSNVALTVIAVFLIVISARLIQLGVLIEGVQDSGRSFVSSCQALINSNQRLESEMMNLRKQIVSLQEQVSKR